MEAYSHGPFEISGYQVTIENPENERQVIMTAWQKWLEKNMADIVIEREYPSLHTVYYNYHDATNLSKK